MTIDDARREVVKTIRAIYDESESSNIATLLVEFVTGVSLTRNLAYRGTRLTTSQIAVLHNSLHRISTNEPIQYVTQTAWFAGMKFFVDRTVLIPRPETEELVEWVNIDIGKSAQKMKVLDVGTGSGCIAVVLKKRHPSLDVWACDISDDALATARINADKLEATIDFVSLNFLKQEARAQLPKFDIIVSNPPYVLPKEKREMSPNVSEYEPGLALFVPDEDWLIFYKALADFGLDHLSASGVIYAEVNETMGKETTNLFLSRGYRKVELRKDFQHKERMVKIEL